MVGMFGHDETSAVGLLVLYKITCLTYHEIVENTFILGIFKFVSAR